MRRTFLYHGHHTITLLDGEVSCGTCSLPVVIVEAVKFMDKQMVRELIIDGAPIKRMI